MSSRSKQHFAQGHDVFPEIDDAALSHCEPKEIGGTESPRDLSSGASCELISVDPFTGASTTRIPLHLSPGRDGFGPEIDLHYDSRSGNGVFGVGWSIDVPSVGRITNAAVPSYADGAEEAFEIGGDELVPALRVSGGWIDDRFEIGEYTVSRYRRRRESSFDRIERWVHQPSGQTHWRTVDRDNVTSLYGINDAGRIGDPEDFTHIARWLLNERFDDRGNVVRYVYKAEDLEGVDLDSPSEAHRRDHVEARGGGRYLKRILYANAAPHDRGPWHYEVVFDYGDHDDERPTNLESQPWAVRPDAFSDNRNGFEIRTWRRCQRVLMFHRFDQLGPAPTLVSSTEFTYDDARSRSTLVEAVRTGYIWRDPDAEERRSTPPLKFGYTGAGLRLDTFELDSNDVVNALVDVNAAARWTDFYSEGLPGVLGRIGPDWQYVRNLGGGRFAKPETVPYDEPEPPVDITDATLAHERSYQPLLMSITKQGQQDDQHVGYIDLNGDLADDVVVASDEVIRWYPSQGEEGFADPVVLRLDDSDRVRPRRLSVDAKQSFHVADVTGDGLLDLVRVRADEVCYWPGLGRGRFGRRVIIGNSPQLKASEISSVLFADLSGNGAVDLVVVADGRLRYWENQGGRSFDAGNSIDAPGVSGATDVVAVDLFGRGFDVVAWLDRRSGEVKARYVGPATDQFADLLSSIDNGRGACARVSYVSSTDLWRRDRDNEIEWLFASPVSQNVVERVEFRDAIASTRLMRRYVFRHAAYERDERLFVGFAASEVWQGGLAEDYALPGLFADEDVLEMAEHRRAPYVVTKRWFHTGAMVDGGDLTEELVGEFHTDEVSGRHRWLAGHQMPTGQKAREVADAYKALRGWRLRKEHAAGVGGVPISVEESTAWVRQLQPARDRRPPCFDAREFETVHVDYDAKGVDPRATHSMVLDIDDFGTITEWVDIAYSSRDPQTEAQRHDSVLAHQRVVSSRTDQSTWYRLAIPIEESQWVLPAIERAGNHLFDPKEVRVAFDGEKRLVRKSRHRYWANDCSRVLEIGEVESRALLGRVERLAFDDECVADVVAEDHVDDLLRYEGGYERDDQGWWAAGPMVAYDTGRFYTVSSSRTAVGHELKIRYDSTALFVSETEDAFGNVSVVETHPRSLQWWRKVDPNGNVTVRRFDPLGNVLSVAALGKTDEESGDVMNPDSIEPSASDDPTAVVTYRLDSWVRDGKPTWVRTRHRERHRERTDRMMERVDTYDALGRQIGSSSRSGDERWLVSDLVELDALGRVVREALPFFADDVTGDEVEREEALRRGRLFSRDARGNVVRIDHPDSTIATSKFDAWSVVHHDAIDNVLDSDWYASRQGSAQGRAGDFGSRRSSRHVFEARAAVQSAMHAQTPTTEQLDVRGRVISRKRSLSRTESVLLTFNRNQFGDVESVVDGDGRVVEEIRRDLLSRQLRRTGIDSGTQSFVFAASGEMLRRHNADGSTTRFRYDAAGACTHVFVASRDGSEVLAERTFWGGGETTVPDAQAKNLVGRPHIRLGAGGMEVVESRNIHGLPIRTVMHPLRAQTVEPDWTIVNEAAHAGQILARLTVGPNPIVETSPLVNEVIYDALSRPLRSTTPGNVALHIGYGAQGRMQIVGVQPSGKNVVPVARDIRFDPAGHLASAILGEDVRLQHRRNVVGRLTEMSVVGRNRDAGVQDHQMVHDANGNVISVTDRGELVASYTYDGLDRLSKAEGFEPDREGDGVRRYTNAYTLDDHGNMTGIVHTSKNLEWQRTYGYEDGHNRLRAASRPEESEEKMAASYDYDQAGNLTTGPSNEAFHWNHDGRLISASVRGITTVFAYDHAGDLRRRISFHGDDVVEETFVWAGFERVRRLRAGTTLVERVSTTVEIDGHPVAVLEQRGSDALETKIQVTDHVGSVIAELAADSSAVSEEEFLPFGVPWFRKGRTEEDLAAKRFGFRGGRFDFELALVLLSGRWYSPWLGRFISPSRTSEGYLLEAGNPQRQPTSW